MDAERLPSELLELGDVVRHVVDDAKLRVFARRELPGASAEERRALAEFLELPDPELVEYLLGQGDPPSDPALARLAQRIRATPFL